MRRAHIALIVMATVFSMAWREKDMQRSLVVYYGICHCLLVFFRLHTRVKARFYTEKIQVTRGQEIICSWDVR